MKSNDHVDHAGLDASRARRRRTRCRSSAQTVVVDGSTANLPTARQPGSLDVDQARDRDRHDQGLHRPDRLHRHRRDQCRQPGLHLGRQRQRRHDMAGRQLHADGDRGRCQRAISHDDDPGRGASHLGRSHPESAGSCRSTARTTTIRCSRSSRRTCRGRTRMTRPGAKPIDRLSSGAALIQKRRSASLNGLTCLRALSQDGAMHVPIRNSPAQSVTKRLAETGQTFPVLRRHA